MNTVRDSVWLFVYEECNVLYSVPVSEFGIYVDEVGRDYKYSSWIVLGKCSNISSLSLIKFLMYLRKLVSLAIIGLNLKSSVNGNSIQRSGLHLQALVMH